MTSQNRTSRSSEVPTPTIGIGSPSATDVGLLVEVSATNVSTDRQQGNLYRRSGIPVYWIVNLVDRRVEVYTDPGSAGYASRTDFPSGQQVPVVIDGRQGSQIAVDDILP